MFSITGLTSEEFDLVSETLNKHREEKEKQAVIEAHDLILREVVTHTIDAIGLDETKRIIRAIHADLRRTSADHI
jgi:hypothetical protein